jgi:Tfp pilus assembly protein FimV
MVAVAQASPAPPPRLVVVTTPPAIRSSTAAVPAATYRRRRLVAAALLAGLLLAVFVGVNALAGPGPARPADGADVPGVVHVVQPGETFWAIAHALRPNEDPRPLVAQLVAAHGSASLTVGERIRLPAGS